MEVGFPPGSRGLLHLYVRDGNLQVWPATNGETFYGDNMRFRFADQYAKLDFPFLFDLWTYNTSTLFAHALWFRIVLLSPEMYRSVYAPGMSQEELEAFLRSLQREGEEARIQRYEASRELFIGSPPSTVPEEEE